MQDALGRPAIKAAMAADLRSAAAELHDMLASTPDRSTCTGGCANSAQASDDITPVKELRGAYSNLKLMRSPNPSPAPDADAGGYDRGYGHKGAAAAGEIDSGGLDTTASAYTLPHTFALPPSVADASLPYTAVRPPPRGPAPEPLPAAAPTYTSAVAAAERNERQERLAASDHRLWIGGQVRCHLHHFTLASLKWIGWQSYKGLGAAGEVLARWEPSSDLCFSSEVPNRGARRGQTQNGPGRGGLRPFDPEGAAAVRQVSCQPVHHTDPPPSVRSQC